MKNLGKEITYVFHPHKMQFQKAIVRHYNYEGNERITTTVGVKSSFFKKRGKLQYKYKETRTGLNPKVKGKRGRSKGSKTKRKKKY